MSTLRAFHGDPQLKADLLAEVAQHRLHDQIVKGTYGQGGNGDWKGCAVGCSLHSLNKKRGTNYSTSDHSAFEAGAGVPRQLAHLQDYLFENLQEPTHIDWPERFWRAIPIGADLELIGPRFVHWLLIDAAELTKHEPTKRALTDCAELYRRWIEGDRPTDREFLELLGRAALADFAALDDRAALDDFAARAALAALDDLAALAARAALAALAALDDLAERVQQQADKLIELLEAA